MGDSRTKSPINSVKHYAHTSSFAITNGVRNSITLVESIVAPATANAFSVKEGSIVSSIYVEYWVSGVTADKTVSQCIVKLPGGSIVPSFTEMTNMGTYKNKKNVLAFHQGLAPTGGNIISFFSNWVKIPKGKQRFGLGDELALVTSANGTNVNLCGFSTFKEYT